MEGIAALGLVSNVIQLIDFTAKLVFQSGIFLRSSADSIPENLRISALVNENRVQTDKILSQLHPLTQEETALHLAASQCGQRSFDLLSVLDDLTVRPKKDGTFSKRKKIWTVLKSRWKHDEVTARRTDLEQAQTQLNTALLLFIKTNQTSGFDDIRAATATIDCAVALLVSKKEVEKIIGQHSNDMQCMLDNIDTRHDHHDAIQEETLQQIKQVHNDSKDLSQWTADKIDILRLAVLTEREEQKAMELIQSLKFPDIDARQDMILEAADRTFGWILGDETKDADRFDSDSSGDDTDDSSSEDGSSSSSGESTSDSLITYHSSETDDNETQDDRITPSTNRESTGFEDWLCKGTGIFWLSGKAGSGKSTLMKFLQQHPRTRDILEIWADTDPLIIASHYFWHSGSHMQKSLEGLLRSLLYQIFTADKRLVKKAFPTYFRMDKQFQTIHWSRRELASALRNICDLNVKICLFIDGMDEYNPHHDHDKLVGDIVAISKSQNIKLCVSSRPWQVFEDAFRHQMKSKLEDLNFRDIKRFVWDTLARAASDPGTRTAFRTQNPDATALVRKIAQKSDGVFLWAHLVVHRLRDWLKIGQSLDELDKYVEDFPSELEEYFRRLIFQRISPTWKSSSATVQALKLTMISHATTTTFEPPGGIPQFISLHFNRSSLLFYWFLTLPGGLTDAKLGENREMVQLSLDDLKTKLRFTRNFLKAICGDLLSISDDIADLSQENIIDWLAFGRVEFFHRTVFDFLMSDHMQILIDENVPKHLGTEAFHAQLQLATAKFILPIFDQARHSRTYSHILKSEGTAFDKTVWRDSGFLESSLLIATDLSDRSLARECESVAIAYVEAYPEELRVLNSGDFWLPEFLASNARTLGLHFISQHLHRFTKAKISMGLNLDQDELRSALGMSNLGTLFRPRGFRLAEIDYNFVSLILEKGVSVQNQCHLFGHDKRSLWHLFLWKWMQELHYYAPDSSEPPDDFSQQDSEHAWNVAKLLIDHGGSLAGMICFHAHQCMPGFICQRARITDILRHVAPTTKYSEVKHLLEAHQIFYDPILTSEIKVQMRSPPNSAESDWFWLDGGLTLSGHEMVYSIPVVGRRSERLLHVGPGQNIS